MPSSALVVTPVNILDGLSLEYSVVLFIRFENQLAVVPQHNSAINCHVAGTLMHIHIFHEYLECEMHIPRILKTSYPNMHTENASRIKAKRNKKCKERTRPNPLNLLDFDGTTEQSSSAGGDETDFLSRNSGARDGGSFSDMLVVSSSVRMVYGVHSHTTSTGPATQGRGC